jgi:hypothetical protein
MTIQTKVTTTFAWKRACLLAPRLLFGWFLAAAMKAFAEQLLDRMHVCVWRCDQAADDGDFSGESMALLQNAKCFVF